MPELGLSKSSYGTVTFDFEPNLQKTFNRGYTTYFLNKRSKDISAINYSKSLGEYIGKVKILTDKYFTLDNTKLAPSDGICFFDEKNELLGTKINKIEGNKVFPNTLNGLRKGAEIYRNFDSKFEAELKKNNCERKINLNITLNEENDNLIFAIEDENGIRIKTTLKNTFENAKQPDKALLTIQKQLAKLGDTEFAVNSLDINITNIPFIPVSELNLIRRELTDKLRIKRKENYPKSIRANELKIIPYISKQLSFENNIYNSKAKLFYEKRGAEVIEPAAELQKNLKSKRIMTTKHCLRYLFDLCPKQTKNKIIPKELILIDAHNKKYKLDFDCNKCELHIYF